MRAEPQARNSISMVAAAAWPCVPAEGETMTTKWNRLRAFLMLLRGASHVRGQLETVTFAQFGASTSLLGNNSAGDLVGVLTKTDGSRVGFVARNGRVSELTYPGVSLVEPAAIN